VAAETLEQVTAAREALDDVVGRDAATAAAAFILSHLVDGCRAAEDLDKA